MFESMPCIVELFGHQQIAGKVTEVEVAGSAMIRVDVPAINGHAAFTKFYGVAAIYAITPTDEETMIRAVQSFEAVPVQPYHFQIPERIPRMHNSDMEDGYEDDEEEGF